MPRRRGVGLELAAQLGDVRVHRAAQHFGAVPPHLAQQVEPGHHGAAPPQQGDEQVELFRRERDGLASAQHRAGGRNHLDVTEPLGRRAAVFPGEGRRRAAQQRLHAGQQLEDTERFGDVIVRAQAQAAHLVRFLAPRREDEDRHGATGFAQRAQHAEPVHPGKHEVEDDQVGPAVARARQSLRAVVRDLDLITFDLQVVAQPVGEVGVVFHHEDARHAGPLAEASCCPATPGEGSSGSSMTNRTPRPPAGSGPFCPSSAQARPPCSATSSRTTASPMPVPATAEPRSRSRRQKRSHTRSRSAAGIPGPWSSTQIRARWSPAARPTVTTCPGGPYLTALSSRLSSIWRNASASTGATTPSASSERRRTPRAPASGANPSSASCTSGASGARAGDRRVTWRSEREKCSRFSTRCVSRRGPSRSGRRERGSPPITSLDANSGRSATATCMPPIIASTVSRAEKVAAYCTGEWYSLAPSAEVTTTDMSESNTTPPVSGRGKSGCFSDPMV